MGGWSKRKYGGGRTYLNSSVINAKDQIDSKLARLVYNLLIHQSEDSLNLVRAVKELHIIHHATWNLRESLEINLGDDSKVLASATNTVEKIRVFGLSDISS